MATRQKAASGTARERDGVPGPDVRTEDDPMRTHSPRQHGMSGLLTLRRAAIVALCLVACSLFGLVPFGCGSGVGDDAAPSNAGAAPFANTDNTPFATRTDGPRGAILYEPAGADPASCREALIRAKGAAEVRMRAESDAANAFVRLLGRHGRKAPGVAFRPNRRAVPVRDGEVLRPSLAEAAGRQAGTGLTFAYVGWTAAEKALLESVVTEAYPYCETYYGLPAFPHTVTIELDPSIANYAEGVYDSGTDTIFLAPLSDNDRNTEFAVVRHMLHAFRDDAMLSYDAWEDGHALAVANLVMAQIEPDWDPTLERSEYSLNLYELLNTPELGNDAIWNTGFSGLIVTRLACASGAWMKVLVEDPRAIAKFNEAYYAQFASDASLAGDVPRLTALMSGIASQVEARGFHDWMRRQYALDTSLPVGNRFYVGMIPTYEAVALFVTYTVVGSDGAEKGQGGTVAVEFWDYTHEYSLFVQEGYEIPIVSTGTSAGIGEYSGSLYNIGGRQRVTIDLILGSEVRHIVYPYNSRREDLDYNADPAGVNLYGALTGRDEGTLTLAFDGGEAVEIAPSQGAFSAHVGEGFLSPGKVTLNYSDADGETLARQYNVGYFDYAIVESLAERADLSHTLLPTETGLTLFSLPATPVTSDEAALFGLEPQQLLLAEWQADQAGDDKYRIYPDIDPIRPGVGYWLKHAAPVTVSVHADLPVTDLPYRVHLSPGWNLVGIPQTTTIAPSSLLFDQGGDPVEYAKAVQNGWVRSVIFAYDPATGGYIETSRLDPWAGYWMRCISADGCNVHFFPETTTASARSDAPTAADRLRALGAEVAELVVRSGPASQRVVLARSGAGRGASDAVWASEAPPAAPGSSLQVGVERGAGLMCVDVSESADRELLVRSAAGGPISLEALSGSIRIPSMGIELAAGDACELTAADATLRVGVRLP